MAEPRKELIIACIDDHPQMMVLLRRAASLAKRKGIPWVAFYVTEAGKDRAQQNLAILKHLHSAEEMGARVKTLDAATFLDGLKSFIAEQSNPSFILFIGMPLSKRAPAISWLPDNRHKIQSLLPAGSVVEAVDFDTALRTRTVLHDFIDRHVNVREIVMALLIVVLTTFVILLLEIIFPDGFRNSLRNRTMIYILGCVFVSLRYGLIPGLISSVLSFFAMNYAFETTAISQADIAKRLQIDSPPMVVSFWLYVLFSCVVNGVAGRAHHVANSMKQRIAQITMPQELFHNAVKQSDIGAALNSMRADIDQKLKLQASFFLPSSGNRDQLKTVAINEPNLSPLDREALMRCWLEYRVTGAGTRHMPDALYCFRPLFTPDGSYGVLAITANRAFFSYHDISETLAAIARVCALVIERFSLAEQMQDSRVRAEKEQLRVTLLSSVSHDLKTPLASIIGSLSALQDARMNASLSAEQKNALVLTALDESRRLNGFITNILDMTRLESGQVVFKQNWVSAFDIISNVYGRMRARCVGRKVTMDESSLRNAEIYTDAFLLEQVIQNIFDNILKYTPPLSSIEISSHRRSDGFEIAIRDRGKGIPKDQLEKIFDKYTRLTKQDNNIAGTGLGLAIARIIMNAQGGTIRADNHPDGGAMFILYFPKWRTVGPLLNVAE